MEIIYGVIGLLTGAVGIYFILNGKINSLLNAKNIAENQATTYKDDLERVSREAGELKEKISNLEARFLEKKNLLKQKQLS